jgi:hypothetical protein
MARHPRLAALGALAAFAAAGGLLGLAGCLPDDWGHHGGGAAASKYAQVTGFRRGTPPWVPPGAYPNTPVFTVTFSKTIHPATVKVGQNVQFQRGIPGPGGTTWVPMNDIMFGPSDAVTAKVYLLVSNKTFDLLVPPNPPKGKVRYRITLFGTDPFPGAGHLADPSGQALDGDSDGHPGGNCKRTIETPPKF